MTKQSQAPDTSIQRECGVTLCCGNLLHRFTSGYQRRTALSIFLDIFSVTTASIIYKQLFQARKILVFP